MPVQSTSDKKPTHLILPLLAEALREILEDGHDDALDKAQEVLDWYDDVFSKKPNVNCRCKDHNGEKSNGSTN